MRFTKRRTEYLLRRWTAKHAVAARLGLPVDHAELARIEVRNAASGAPEVWVDGEPAGLGISLTDRAGWGVCLVADRAGAVGCDLELVEPRSLAFVRDFLTEAEQRLVLAAGSEAGRQVVANVVWSAKESALKVLRTGLGRDTRSVEVSLDPQPGPDERTDGWAPLAVRSTEGAELGGWWCRQGAFLVTVACDTLTAPPVSIEDSPRIAAAEPVHSWLHRPTYAVHEGSELGQDGTEQQNLGQSALRGRPRR
jgi:4'-phosphopantetheinyl transferase